MTGLVGFAILLKEEGKLLMQNVGGTLTRVTGTLPGPIGQEMGTGGGEGGGESLFGPKDVGKGTGRREGGGQGAPPLQKSRERDEGDGVGSGERSLGPRKEGGDGEDRKREKELVGRAKRLSVVGRRKSL